MACQCLKNYLLTVIETGSYQPCCVFILGNIIDPGDDMIFRVQLPSGEIHDLPHARTVSTSVHDGTDTKAAQATLLLMQVFLQS